MKITQLVRLPADDDSEGMVVKISDDPNGFWCRLYVLGNTGGFEAELNDKEVDHLITQLVVAQKARERTSTTSSIGQIIASNLQITND